MKLILFTLTVCMYVRFCIIANDSRKKGFTLLFAEKWDISLVGPKSIALLTG